MLRRISRRLANLGEEETRRRVWRKDDEINHQGKALGTKRVRVYGREQFVQETGRHPEMEGIQAEGQSQGV